MTSKRKLTHEQRLDRLLDSALKRAKAADQAGEPVPVAELNGLRRLIEHRTRAREFEEVRRLTKY